MLYWLLYPLKSIHEISFFGVKIPFDLAFLRIFSYVTFRAVAAAVTSLIIMYWIGPRFINFLVKLKFKETVREDGPKTHGGKAGTPTMGGLLIIAAMSISVLLWGNLENRYIILILICTLCISAIGFRDDYQKSILKIQGGMKAHVKMGWLLFIAILFSLAVYYFPYNPTSEPHLNTQLFLPFLKEPVMNLGFWAVPFWVIIISGTSNAVNLTDGLDGLATGVSSIALATLAIIAYVTGVAYISKYLLIPFIPEVNELTVFLAAFTASCAGFLWYNAHPAEVFMGDTGSLAIGGAIGMSAILIKREILLLILGGIFVAEALSVIIQVVSFKIRGKRIFLMAPLHHHFELKGWHENKVVIRFWIVATLLGLLSLSSLKIL